MRKNNLSIPKAKDNAEAGGGGSGWRRLRLAAKIR
jgi:hypothetical protein